MSINPLMMRGYKKRQGNKYDDDDNDDDDDDDERVQKATSSHSLSVYTCLSSYSICFALSYKVMLNVLNFLPISLSETKSSRVICSIHKRTVR